MIPFWVNIFGLADTVSMKLRRALKWDIFMGRFSSDFLTDSQSRKSSRSWTCDRGIDPWTGELWYMIR